jgi:DNA invertase Pin-like site-specific DNA recombinase
MPPYGYLRESRVVDLATNLAPETQEREVQALAARFGDNGGSLVLLADWDISGAGKHTKKRPGYQELVKVVEDGRCTAVYSHSLSRLGRSVKELSNLFDLCHAKDIPIRLVADSVDTSTASGRLMANILASLAQFESDVTGERRRAQIMSKRARGESLRTRRRYGEADDEDAGMVLDLYRATGSYTATARRLNDEGIPARSGKQWWAASVKLVVRRLDPTVRSAGRGRKSHVAFALARLLQCPTCETRNTGTRVRRGAVRYACSNHASQPHARKSVSERLVLPWITAEAARL